MQRNVGTRISDDDNLTLYVCDADRCPDCVGCPCEDVHTEADCVGTSLGCQAWLDCLGHQNCRPVDQFVAEEIEKEYYELFPVVFGIRMGVNTIYGGIKRPVKGEAQSDT